MIVTIDGPAGSGKSTVARETARRLRFQFLDTGAIYRAFTWLALRDGIPPTDEARLVEMIRASAPSLVLEGRRDGTRVEVAGTDVSAEIRREAVTREVKGLAALPEVRRELAEIQRRLVAGIDVVAEGRDMGSVVFPHATAKFYLDAGIDERARRRTAEMRAQGQEASLPEVRDAILRRDREDMTRAVAPLVRTADMVVIDTSGRSIEDVVEGIVETTRKMARETAGQGADGGPRAAD